MTGVAIIAARKAGPQPGACPWNRPADPRDRSRGAQARTKGLVSGLVALAALLLVAGSGYVRLASLRDPSSQVIAQIDGRERDRIRSIEIGDCRDSVLAGQDLRLAVSDSLSGRAELARRLDNVVQYCGCAFEAGSQLLTKDDVIKHWAAQGRAYQEGALGADRRALLDRSARICAEKAGLRTDVADGTP